MIPFLRLMVIDDNETQRFIIGEFQAKYKIAANYYDFESATDAIVFIKANPCALPDLILLDIKLPGLDGFDFLRETKSIFDAAEAKPYIFILTSSRDSISVEHAGEFNVAGYLIKPLTKQKLDYVFSFKASVKLLSSGTHGG